jgi:DNA-binding transcriptional ArsR family regulator
MAMTTSSSDVGPGGDPGAGSDSGQRAAASLFRSLGDPTRLAILNQVSRGEQRVVDLTRHLGLAQSTVSAHCACLRDCGLLVARPEGRATVYALAAPLELQGLLTAAQQLLATAGDAVVVCPTYGHEANR